MPRQSRLDAPGTLHHHLNPLRATVVPDLPALDRCPWTGHSALLGAVPRPWQNAATILSHFGATRRRARRAYPYSGTNRPTPRRGYSETLCRILPGCQFP